MVRLVASPQSSMYLHKILEMRKYRFRYNLHLLNVLKALNQIDLHTLYLVVQM